ncbi:transposase [Carbonactinospora thermoautotrophica]|uniref:Transposase n=1 Tax=Carbonactinospora thermoautotrophica TaxID=1469144 RepID=A0A132ML33_9ACTN|nr:transposase [Carbonactinospora thermoautotrophica]KWW97753.1 transposase [Carbonactinospora thermoautotrophica]KWW98570.1 Transposase IS3/IS911 family protein [Carbonactinospora thermoautotrophica]KWX06240.1 transposase [Carbonactinospora thermoautotrophica]
MGRPSKFPPELERDAVELVRATGKPVRQVARELGINPETLRGWVRQDKIDRGEGLGGELTSAEREELKRLRREVAELRMEKEILAKAAAFFVKEATR